MIITSVYPSVLKLIDIAPVFTKCLETYEEMFRAVSTLQNVSKLFLCILFQKMYSYLIIFYWSVNVALDRATRGKDW